MTANMEQEPVLLPSVQPNEELLDRLFGTRADLAAQRIARLKASQQENTGGNFDPLAEGLDCD